MPQTIAYLLFAGPLGGIFSFSQIVGGVQLLLGIGTSVIAQLFVKKPSVPKPEDGNYNIKQSVPSLAVVLGRTKKGGDYVFLEEKDGIAYQVIVHAGHRVNAYVQHSLHDEDVTIDGSGTVTLPAHFYPSSSAKVAIATRLGLSLETSYSGLVSLFPTIWTSAHRGDGLASVAVSAQSVAVEEYQNVYPNQLPVHSAVIEGALLYDPRDATHDPDDETTWDWSDNIALERLWHLIHPSGGKLTIDDLYLPDWINAANVCDENVTDRFATTQDRYHGGFWYRYENNPVDVGRLMDQAAELVLYETAEGLVGVHAGAYVEPDIRLTEADIQVLGYDANRSEASNVLAVRGRYTDPSKRYNTVDAAIYGDPYVSDASERSKTIDNQVVQWHNHMQRLQKLAKIRANAPRVRIIADYEPAKNVPYRRFITVHMPPKLDEAIIEITGRPKLSLANLTFEFEGIVVPSTLYSFNAASEEGTPGGTITLLSSAGVPVPAGLAITINRDNISGSISAGYAVATWTAQSSLLQVEMEYVPSAGGVVQSTRQRQGETSIRTNFLADGVEYKFRIRNWSGGAHSDWSAYVYETVYADNVAPAALVGAGYANLLGRVDLSWTNPSSANLARVRIYHNTTGVLNTATDLLTTRTATPSAADSYNHGTAGTDLITNGTFASGTGWTLDTNWAIGSGVATKSTSAANRNLTQSGLSLTNGVVYRLGFQVTAWSADDLLPRLQGGATANGTQINVASGIGRKVQSITATAAHTSLQFTGFPATAISIDNVQMYAQVGGNLSQGIHYYWLIPENGSGKPGPTTALTPTVT